MNYEKTDMLTGIFPDIWTNRNECLLCINLSTVIRHYKIIGRTRKYNYSSTIK